MRYYTFFLFILIQSSLFADELLGTYSYFPTVPKRVGGEYIKHHLVIDRDDHGTFMMIHKAHKKIIGGPNHGKYIYRTFNTSRGPFYFTLEKEVLTFLHSIDEKSDIKTLYWIDQKLYYDKPKAYKNLQLKSAKRLQRGFTKIQKGKPSGE